MIHRMPLVKAAAALALAAAVTVTVTLLGCGGAPGTRPVTRLDGSTPINKLSPGQTAQLCSDVQSYYTSSISQGADCNLQGFLAAALTAIDPGATDADIQASCAAAYAQCSSSPADAGAGSFSTCGDSGADITDCTATVGEYASCVSDLTAATNHEFASLPSCGVIDRASLASDSGTLPPGPSTPPTCAVIATKCPSLNPAGSTAPPDGGT
jgi:hypothetical protein